MYYVTDKALADYKSYLISTIVDYIFLLAVCEDDYKSYLISTIVDIKKESSNN